MKHIRFDFGSSSKYINLVDNVIRTDIRSLLGLLVENCNEQYGFNYELGSKVKQYYSNVHATVLFNLFVSHLLDNTELKVLQDALFRLRDSNPNTFYEKSEKDKYAWDTIEGPNVFSTALACYALLLTNDPRTQEIGESIKWLLKQRNDKRIWPFLKGGADNYVITLYTVLTLQLWVKLASDVSLKQEIDAAFYEVKNFIENSFVTDGTCYFVPRYGSGAICLSNTITCLYLLRLLASSKLSEVLGGTKRTIERVILEDTGWYLSELSDVRADNRIKRMYTYNPAYLPVLLKMGWDLTDKVILKMLFWMISDLRSFWMREGIMYPWRSSDSVIQSFICSFSVQSICTWLQGFLKTGIQDLESNLDKLISGRDVFLCHASEDKKGYVKPLYDELVKNGITVWYDEGEILWGDRITTKIDEGIKISKFAIVCFSNNFLKKEWPESEFSSLYSRQQAESRKIVLPLILNSEQEVLEKYQLIRGISYKRWNKDKVSALTSEIKKILKR